MRMETFVRLCVIEILLLRIAVWLLLDVAGGGFWVRVSGFIALARRMVSNVAPAIYHYVESDQ